MALSAKRSTCLAGLPVEILLDVYQHLDLAAISELSATNRFFHSFFKQRKTNILLPVLEREFSPFGELLQVYTASSKDIVDSGGIYKPRKVVFKRFAGDHGLVLSPGVQFQALSPASPSEGFTSAIKGRAVSSFESSPNTAVLTESDLEPILRQCEVVRQWEELFPQMRWFHQPENCRFLRPHELIRFRRALYRWWLYGIYFHSELPRPRAGHPEPHVDDIRTSQMRYHSTGQLLELMDLLETIKDVILHYICPRLDASQHQTPDPPALVEAVGRGHSLATSWSDQSRWGRIIKTYAKLGPEELLFYFDHIYSYPRKRLIAEVHLQHPSFTFDQESIQIAVRCALDERQWLVSSPNLADDGGGGIVDFDDERDDERLALEGDASPDGSLPPGTRFVQSYSRYSPRGDDGSFLEDFPRPSGVESRWAASAALDAVV